MPRVRGIGVAVSVSTSTSARIALIISLWRTPKRCSSSITSRPRRANFTSGEKQAGCHRAIHHDLCTADVACLFGCQKHDGVGDVLAAAKAPQRNRIRAPLAHLGLRVERFRQASVDEAWRHSIGANAKLAPFNRHLLGQFREAGLRRRISPGARTGREAGDGCDVDYHTATARNHSAYARLRHNERRDQIDRNHVGKRRGGLLVQRSKPADACIVDQQIDIPERSDGRRASRLVCDVCDQGHAPGYGSGVTGHSRGRNVQKPDFPIGGSERGRNGKTNVASTARHKCALACFHDPISSPLVFSLRIVAPMDAARKLSLQRNIGRATPFLFFDDRR